MGQHRNYPPRGVRRAAIQELRRAMAGEGLTVAKVQRFTATLDLPLVRDAVAAAPPERSAIVAFHTIVDAARGLGDGVPGRVLRNALAIDYAGDAKDLTGRRAELVRTHNGRVHDSGGRSFLGETPRAIYDLEQKMLDALVAALGSP